MKKLVKLLPIVVALLMLFSFGALATEEGTPINPDETTEVTPPEGGEETEPEEPEITLPEAPTGFSTYTTNSAFVVVNWETVEGVNGYNVYVKRGSEWIFDQTTEKTQALVHDLLLNSKHDVGIKSFVEVDGVKYESEELCQGTVTTLDYSPVTIYLFNKTKSVKDGIKLVWETEDAITGYRLYVVKGGKWVKIKDIYGMEQNEYLYTDESMEYGKTYKFGIKTFVKGTEGLVFSDLRTHSVKHEDVMRVNVKAAKKTSSTVTLSWNKAEDAWGYRVYVYQSGKWKALKTTTALSYQVTGLEASKRYIFRVKAYSRINGEVIWHAASANCSVITSSKTVSAYRIKDLQKSFSDGDWYIKLKNMVDGNGNKVTMTLAGKGENLFLRYDYGKGVVIEYFYQASKGRLYIISDADKEYVIVPQNEAVDLVNTIYAMAEVMKVQNVGKVTARTTVYNGYSAVQETYTDTKYEFKKTYYFVKDKVAGLTVEYEGAKDVFKYFSVVDTPSNSLFRVPGTYTQVSY